MNIYQRFKLWVGTKIMLYIMKRQIKKSQELFSFIEGEHDE